MFLYYCSTPNRTNEPRPMVVIGYSRRWLFRPEVGMTIPRKEWELLSDKVKENARIYAEEPHTFTGHIHTLTLAPTASHTHPHTRTHTHAITPTHPRTYTHAHTRRQAHTHTSKRTSKHTTTTNTHIHPH